MLIKNNGSFKENIFKILMLIILQIFQDFQNVWDLGRLNF